MDLLKLSEIEEKVKLLLGQRHKIHPEDRSALGSFNVEKEYQEVQGLFSGIRAVSWLVSIMTIIAGVVGVGEVIAGSEKNLSRRSRKCLKNSSRS